MSQHADFGPALGAGEKGGRGEPLSVESGLEALRSSPEFRGPVEPLEGVDANEHIALFYESREEQFAAVVPFVRQGLRRGERVMYVVGDGDEAAVRSALREGGIDVAAAVESGVLTFNELSETYRRNGTFDVDDMLDFYGRTIEEVTAEYPGLRITAPTSWLLDDETHIEDFMAYESRVNDLFEGEDCIALCQYDRRAMPPELLRHVVRTHPHLVYDGTLCHNFYYTPPEEYFEPDEPARDVERMLGTLVDRTEAKVQLDDTIADLEAANERLSRFAYVASHDLQEPLRMVSSYLRLLDGRYGDRLDEDGREFVEHAVDGADRMREMIDGLLQYSRVDMGEESFERVDCDRLVEGVLTDLRTERDDGDATVAVDDLPPVDGDVDQLRQVFRNLLENAFEYSGDEPPAVEIGVTRHGDRCVFSVADEGIGIDPEYTDQIFEVFTQLHAGNEYRGTGIGLALCRKIVDNHGGDIWIDTEPGEGTTVYFTLRGASCNRNP